MTNGMSKEESEQSWRDMLQAFEKAMTGLQYGEEETRDARTWFASGWLAAKMDERRQVAKESPPWPWPTSKPRNQIAAFLDNEHEESKMMVRTLSTSPSAEEIKFYESIGQKK